MSTGDAIQAVVLVGAVALVVMVLGQVRRSSLRVGQRVAQAAPVPLTAPLLEHQVAVVANPTKISDVEAETAWVTRHCERIGWGPPIWLSTTVEDPGHGQTASALTQGAKTVIAYGGDGTVRAVAAELAGSGVPLGILPAGTGNLLARNLSIPVGDLDAALTMALNQRARRLDVARVEVDVSGEDHSPRRDTFLVMAGIGFDAEVMATVEPHLKNRVGWWAYVVAGARKLSGERTRVRILLDGAPAKHRRVRSVLIGNCGELTGGLRLMPDALVDDGWLDVAVFAPRGIVGWGAVIATVLTRSHRGYPVVQHFRCRSVEIHAELPLHVQLDGDPVGRARVLRARVDPLALQVHCER